LESTQRELEKRNGYGRFRTCSRSLTAMAVMARHVGEGGFTAVEAQFTGGRCGPLMKPTRTLSQEVAVVSPRSSVRRLNAPAAAAAPPTQQIPSYSSSTTKFAQQQRSSKLLDSAMEKKAQTWYAPATRT